MFSFYTIYSDAKGDSSPFTQMLK